MEIQYIREFVALTKCGNYMTAAEELYISQSSLSKHIMALEKELGFSLFARTTRKVQLTQHGKLFLPYAQSIIEADAEFRARAAAANSDARESIQLGVLPSFLFYHLDQVIPSISHFGNRGYQRYTGSSAAGGHLQCCGDPDV